MPGWSVVLLVGVGCLGTGILLGVGAAISRLAWYDADRDYLPSQN